MKFGYVKKKIYKQTGTVKNPLMDQLLTALPPGRRVSKNGNVYFETRKNRSDVPGTKM